MVLNFFMLVLKYIFQICVFYGRRTKLEIVLKLILFKVSIPNPPLYRLKKNGLGVTSLSKSVLSLFDLVLWEQFFPVYWSLQGRYFFECGSQPCVRIHTGLQAASQQRIKYAVVLCTAVIA